MLNPTEAQLHAVNSRNKVSGPNKDKRISEVITLKQIPERGIVQNLVFVEIEEIVIR